MYSHPTAQYPQTHSPSGSPRISKVNPCSILIPLGYIVYRCSFISFWLGHVLSKWCASISHCQALICAYKIQLSPTTPAVSQPSPRFCQPRIGKDTLHRNLALSSQSRVRIGHRMAARHVVQQVAHLGYILTTEMPDMMKYSICTHTHTHMCIYIYMCMYVYIYIWMRIYA